MRVVPFALNERSLTCCVQVLVPAWILASERRGGEIVGFQEARPSEMTAEGYSPPSAD